MREDWKYERLLDACDVYQPATISTKQLVEDGEFDVFGANGKIGKYSSYNHEESEVLLTCRGATCGNINVSTPKSWINGNAMVVHPKEKNLLKNYLVYLLKTINYAEVITGSAQPQITRLSLKNIHIPVPPLAEQERIVSLLDTQFAKIDALKANAASQLQAAKDLFQAALKQLLTPQKGWEMKTLDEISNDMYRGSGITRDQITNDGISCVRYGEIYTTYNYWFDKCKSHTDESKIKSPKYFENGDILFTITGESVEDIAKSVAYLGVEKCLAGGDIVVMKHNQNAKYLSYALSTPDAIKQKGLGKTKLKVVHSNVPSIKSIVVPIPSLPEQERIAARLDAISEKVKALQANYDQTRNLCNDLKQSLLKSIFE
jgi:type I restriction enzyme S subunit